MFLAVALVKVRKEFLCMVVDAAILLNRFEFEKSELETKETFE